MDPHDPARPREDVRAARLLARSLFRRFSDAGFRRPELVAFVTELLDLELREARKGA